MVLARKPPYSQSRAILNMSPFPIAEAQIVALFLETVFYGMYLVSLGYCLRALLVKRDKLLCKQRHEINWAMLVIASLMAIFATLDVALGLRHNLEAFVYYTGPGGAQAEFSHVSYWVNVMKSVDYIAQTAIGDAILIYRLYIVYEKSRQIVIVPAILWVATLASGCALISVEISTKHSALLEDTRLSKWNDCVCVFTLVLNIFVTSLIVWRLWRVRHEVMSITTIGPDRLKKVIRIVLDSGLIYTVLVVIFFGTALGHSNAQYGVSDIVVQIIGITFNLIIIRVDDARSGSSEHFVPSTLLPQSAPKQPRRVASTFPPISTIQTSTRDTGLTSSSATTPSSYTYEEGKVEAV